MSGRRKQDEDLDGDYSLVFSPDNGEEDIELLLDEEDVKLLKGLITVMHDRADEPVEDDEDDPLDNVIVMPGVERRDLMGPPCLVEGVLNGALEQPLSDVIVVGRLTNGNWYIAARDSNPDITIAKLFSAATFLSTHSFEHD